MDDLDRSRSVLAGDRVDARAPGHDSLALRAQVEERGKVPKVDPQCESAEPLQRSEQEHRQQSDLCGSSPNLLAHGPHEHDIPAGAARHSTLARAPISRPVGWLPGSDDVDGLPERRSPPGHLYVLSRQTPIRLFLDGQIFPTVAGPSGSRFFWPRSSCGAVIASASWSWIMASRIDEEIRGVRILKC